MTPRKSALRTNAEDAGIYTVDNFDITLTYEERLAARENLGLFFEEGSDDWLEIAEMLDLVDIEDDTQVA